MIILDNDMLMHDNDMIMHDNDMIEHDNDMIMHEREGEASVQHKAVSRTDHRAMTEK